MLEWWRYATLAPQLPRARRRPSRIISRVLMVAWINRGAGHPWWPEPFGRPNRLQKCGRESAQVERECEAAVRQMGAVPRRARGGEEIFKDRRVTFLG